MPQPNGVANQDDARPNNRLLAGLPYADFARLKPYLQTMRVGQRHVFHRANQPVSEVFFLNGGMASITTTLEDGSMVEVATVGDEGFVGIEAMFGSAVLGRETLMQVPDTSAERLASLGPAFRAGHHRSMSRNAGCKTKRWWPTRPARRSLREGERSSLQVGGGLRPRFEIIDLRIPGRP